MVKATHKTTNTLILTGHYDVVSVEGFGQLKDYAFDLIEHTKWFASSKFTQVKSETNIKFNEQIEIKEYFSVFVI